MVKIHLPDEPGSSEINLGSSEIWLGIIWKLVDWKIQECVDMGTQGAKKVKNEVEWKVNSVVEHFLTWNSSLKLCLKSLPKLKLKN